MIKRSVVVHETNHGLMKLAKPHDRGALLVRFIKHSASEPRVPNGCPKSDTLSGQASRNGLKLPACESAAFATSELTAQPALRLILVVRLRSIHAGNEILINVRFEYSKSLDMVVF